MLLGTGWALIGCGLAAWVRQPDGRFGPLFAAAGFAWFLLEWNNPGIDSALAFTVGLCLYASCPPLVAHAVLVDAGGATALARREAVALALAYAALRRRPRARAGAPLRPHRARLCGSARATSSRCRRRRGLADD